MANVKSHHLVEADRSIYFLVRLDQQPREARHITRRDDGTTTESIHMLYWEKNPKETGTTGEVRSMPIEEWPKPAQPIALPPEMQPLPTTPLLTFDQLVGTDASALPDDATDLLRLFGGVDAEGKVLAVEAWASRG